MKVYKAKDGTLYIKRKGKKVPIPPEIAKNKNALIAYITALELKKNAVISAASLPVAPKGYRPRRLGPRPFPKVIEFTENNRFGVTRETRETRNARIAEAKRLGLPLRYNEGDEPAQVNVTVAPPNITIHPPHITIEAPKPGSDDFKMLIPGTDGIHLAGPRHREADVKRVADEIKRGHESLQRGREMDRVLGLDYDDEYARQEYDMHEVGSEHDEPARSRRPSVTRRPIEDVLTESASARQQSRRQRPTADILSPPPIESRQAPPERKYRVPKPLSPEELESSAAAGQTTFTAPVYPIGAIPSESVGPAGDLPQPQQPMAPPSGITAQGAISQADLDRAIAEGKRISENVYGIGSSGSGSDLGKHALTTSQLDAIMAAAGSKYLGTIGKDQIDMLQPIPNAPIQGFIMNLDPSWKSGSHWVGVIVTPKTIEYHDSFGDPPPRDILPSLKRLAAKISPHSTQQFKINRIVQQRANSTNCGYHSAKWLYDRFNGMSFKDSTGYSDVLNSERAVRGYMSELKKLPEFQHFP